MILILSIQERGSLHCMRTLLFLYIKRRREEMIIMNCEHECARERANMKKKKLVNESAQIFRVSP